MTLFGGNAGIQSVSTSLLRTVSGCQHLYLTLLFLMKTWSYYFVLHRSSNLHDSFFLEKILIIFCTQSSTYICKLCYLLFIRYIAHHRDSKLMIEMVSLKIIIDFRFVYFTLNSSHRNRLCVTDTNFSTVYGIWVLHLTFENWHAHLRNFGIQVIIFIPINLLKTRQSLGSPLKNAPS